MNKNKGGLPVIQTVLTLALVGILMFILFGIMELHDRDDGAVRIIFAAVNCIILITVAVTGKIVTRRTTFATLVQLWTATSFYTMFQFGFLFFGFVSGKWYILIQLIIIFLYLCISLPVLNISYKNKNQTTSEGE